MGFNLTGAFTQDLESANLRKQAAAMSGRRWRRKLSCKEYVTEVLLDSAYCRVVALPIVSVILGLTFTWLVLSIVSCSRGNRVFEEPCYFHERTMDHRKLVILQSRS